MRLISPAVVARQEQDRLCKEKHTPKQDRIPRKDLEDDLHEMSEAPFFKTHAPASIERENMQGRAREHLYNLRKFICRLVRFQHTDF